MSRSERSANDEARSGSQSASADAREEPPAREGSPAGGILEQFAASTLRVGLAFLGLVILLFGVGQAVGLDLLGLLASVLNSPVARWIAVALFGLILISVAFSGFRRRRPPR